MSISYSEHTIFTRAELDLLHRAESYVNRIPEAFADSRCHEIARAVGYLLNLSHQDGYYGFIDHSWLWTRPLERTVGRIGFPHVLDVYCVGSLPMVRIVDGAHTSLPHIGWAYRPGEERQDIDIERLKDLIRAMRP